MPDLNELAQAWADAELEFEAADAACTEARARRDLAATAIADAQLAFEAAAAEQRARRKGERALIDDEVKP